MPRLSIIVPIYNSECYLRRCIESILSQNYLDFELLLINDGSTDKSLDVCYGYAINDDRIKVIDKKNSGVSATRNTGLSIATGTWITFVDSDDWLSEGYFDVMNTSLSSDLVVGTIFFKSNNTVINLLKDNVILRDSGYFTILEKELTNPLLNGPMAKFFRKTIIDKFDLRFDERLCFGEDAVFVKEYLLHISTLQTSNDILYNYDDIGDDIYRKYSKSFVPIYDYYLKMSGIYTALEDKFNIVLCKKDLVGVVYNISAICLQRDRLKEWSIIRKFLLDADVRKIMKDRGSLHINIILMLSYDFFGVIFITYFNFIEFLKKYFRR